MTDLQCELNEVSRNETDEKKEKKKEEQKNIVNTSDVFVMSKL